MAATYTKLKSGEWGIRSTTAIREGESVSVRKQSGETKTETVAKIVWNGNGVWLAAIGVRSNSSYTPRAGRRRPAGDCDDYCQGCPRCW